MPRIPSTLFYKLIAYQFTSFRDKKVIMGLFNDQNKYPKLTNKKINLFWKIYYTYFPIKKRENKVE